MKVLVTGSRGYIGSVLVRMLLERDHAVVGLDSDLFAECTFVDSVPEVKTHLVDCRDAGEEVFDEIDAVIHLAGLSNDPLGDYRPGLTKKINEDASVRLAAMAKKRGVKRFLYASSCSTYGAAGEEFLDERSTFNPVTPYGESKVNVEKRVSVMADDTFSPTFLRASTAYGLSPRIRFDLVTNNLTAWACTTGQVYLKSDGSAWRPIVHVEDIALAYIAVLEEKRSVVHNQAFNVGQTSENYRISEIAKLVHEIVPGCEVAFAPEASADKRCYRVDCNKIVRTLHGYKPQWTARRGIEQLYDAYSRTDLTLEQFEGSQFKRIAHIRSLIDRGVLDEDLRRNEPVTNEEEKSA
ncbi:MAG: NAD-dependent epimerase/dehydratase family protein [Chitinivibrionales bacterium]|nr:NAD-dependent epimerase/dehydratase family protein [Chitinivibrionales bacterium]